MRSKRISRRRDLTISTSKLKLQSCKFQLLQLINIKISIFVVHERAQRKKIAQVRVPPLNFHVGDRETLTPPRRCTIRRNSVEQCLQAGKVSRRSVPEMYVATSRPRVGSPELYRRRNVPVVRRSRSYWRNDNAPGRQRAGERRRRSEHDGAEGMPSFRVRLQSRWNVRAHGRGLVRRAVGLLARVPVAPGG